MVKTLVNVAVVAVVMAVSLYFLAPGIWAGIDNWYQENAGWTEEAKRKDPVRYLEHIIGKTRTEYSKLDQYIGEYRASIRRLERERSKSQQKADAANGLLSELKDIYKRVKSGELQWPAKFRGGIYTEDQLKKQVATLLTERDAQQSVVAKLTSKIEKLTKKLDKIRTARVEYASKLSVLEADLSVAKADIGSSELDSLIEKADEILAYVDESSNEWETPLRTTDELLDNESEVEIDENRAKADEFLNS